jgi:hypothetical protein
MPDWQDVAVSKGSRKSRKTCLPSCQGRWGQEGYGRSGVVGWRGETGLWQVWDRVDGVEARQDEGKLGRGRTRSWRAEK